MAEWISVKDRLPEYGERVLIARHPFVGEAFLGQGGYFIRYKYDEDSLPWVRNATHWMPLPAPPEGE